MPHNAINTDVDPGAMAFARAAQKNVNLAAHVDMIVAILRLQALE
jgi:hypothetical protein